MKKIKLSHKIFASLAMFFIVIAMLITSAQIAIYGDSDYGFYQKEYEKYEVTADLGMSMDDTMKATKHMMSYLIGDEDELGIEVTAEGVSQDFFNDKDRLHMADVRNLFLRALKLRWILLAAGVLIFVILVLQKANIRRLLFAGYCRALAFCAGIMAFLSIAFTIDFTKCFTIFHRIFFTNDLWMFDPRNDYMIRMLPEEFFFDMVVRIAIFFAASLVAMLIALWALRKTQKKDH